jgi:hypothetical protein
MEQKIVVHMKDGTIHKGLTQDFDPQKKDFYLLPAEGGGVPIRIDLEEMKALFYVRDYVGNSDFVARKDFETALREGKKVVLTFTDGEEMWGTVSELPEHSAGFYFYPADGEDNNIRIFVIRSSLKDMRLTE